MKFVFRHRLVRIGLVGALAAACGGTLVAQQDDRIKIKPYSGPPIYLDEPEQVAPPTLVTREKHEDKAEDGKLRIEREVAIYSDNHFEADGAYREFYPNGQVFVEGQFRKGRQHGEWTFHFENGQLNRKANYVEGQPHGQWDVFRADGTLAAKRSFENGKRDGQWTMYDQSGKQPLREEHYADGKFDGVWKFWYPNGQLKQQIGFKQGQRDGTSTEWDDKGQKRAEVTYVGDKLHGTATRWFPDGRTIVQVYQDGKLESQSSK